MERKTAHRLSLSSDEISAIEALLHELISRYDSVEDPKFLQEVSVYAQELPRSVRRFMNEFRILGQSSGGCVISSYLLDDERIGPTPAHRANWSVPPLTLAEEIFFVLRGSLPDDLMGWTTQQAGKLVHDIVPIKGDEYKQISSASKEPIWWHAEDAFHPYRADFVGLMCLRNPTNTITTFACIDHLKLDELQLKALFQPRFIIRQDYSHLSEPASKSLAQQHLPRAQKN